MEMEAKPLPQVFTSNFTFGGNTYVVNLDSTGLTWTRANGTPFLKDPPLMTHESEKARKHEIKLTQMLGAALTKDKKSFHVFYMTPKDEKAQGARQFKTISFAGATKPKQVTHSSRTSLQPP
jgi:hypothetical protein